MIWQTLTYSLHVFILGWGNSFHFRFKYQYQQRRFPSGRANTRPLGDNMRRLISCSTLFWNQLFTVTGSFHAPLTMRERQMIETDVKYIVVLCYWFAFKEFGSHWSWAQILIDQLVDSPASIRSCYTNPAMFLNGVEAQTHLTYWFINT